MTAKAASTCQSHSVANVRYTMSMREYEILARGLYRPDQLIITYDPSLRMPSSPAIQQWMDTFWARKLAEAQERGIPLFDAPLYRFVDVESRADGYLHVT